MQMQRPKIKIVWSFILIWQNTVLDFMAIKYWSHFVQTGKDQP